MTVKDTIRPQTPPQSPAERILDLYVIGLSVVMMLFGLRQWAVIVGIVPGVAGPFADMSTPWMLATMHMAVVDLVASVGLWMRVAWGKVIWLYAAIVEILLHTVFYSIFGANWPLIAFHAISVVVFVSLTIWVWQRVPA